MVIIYFKDFKTQTIHR